MINTTRPLLHHGICICFGINCEIYEFICFILFFRVAVKIFVLVKEHATARRLIQRYSTSTSSIP